VFDSFLCPNCRDALMLRERSLVCEQGHCFDLAKQGYANLLPVNAKRSKSPGDSKEMVQARTAWLDTNLYEPIAATVAQLLDGYSDSVLDTGCGEGYYTNFIAPFCGKLAGIDISKFAIIAAAKRNKVISFAVASNRQLPVADASQSAVLSLFGFPVEAEFLRVLKPGGVVIHAEAAADHLIEFRRALYPEIKPFNRVNYYTQLQRITELPVEFDIKFSDKAQALSLLKMTPHYFRASSDALAKWMDDPVETVTVSVSVSLYQKPE